jgi:hypothetical protein
VRQAAESGANMRELRVWIDGGDGQAPRFDDIDSGAYLAGLEVAVEAQDSQFWIRCNLGFGGGGQRHATTSIRIVSSS